MRKHTYFVSFFSLAGLCGLLAAVSLVQTSAAAPAAKTLVPLPNCTMPTPVVARYYANPSFQGQPVLIRCEALPENPLVLFQKDYKTEDLGGLKGRFSARYNAQVGLLPGSYRLNSEVVGGVKVYLDDELLLKASSPAQSKPLDVQTQGGQYSARIDFVGNVGSGKASLSATPSVKT